MMEALNKYRYAIIATVVLAAGFFVYQYFFTGSDVTSLLVSESGTNNSQIAAEGQQLVALLNEMRALQLETNIFENEAFRALEDYGIDAEDEPLGRDNPFEPSPGVQQLQ